MYKYTLSVSVLAMLFGSSIMAEENIKNKASKAAPVMNETQKNVTSPVPVMLPDVMRKDTFKKVDKNSDGKISFEELQEFKEQRKKARAKKEVDQMMKGCDKDNDGMISINELPSEEDMQHQMDNIEFAEPENIEKMLSSRCMFPKEILEVMDFNEDGMLSREEMMQGISMDRAPNKKVERKLEKKRLSRQAKRRKTEFKKCDSNADDLLTLREAFSMQCSLHLYTEQFDGFDINSDGLLTIDEISKEVKPVEFNPPEDPNLIERRKKMPPLRRLESAFYDCDKDEDGRLGKSETISAKCEQDPVYFDTVDNDLDGYITQKELSRMRSKERFDRMDKNKDGVLDSSEYKSSYY